MNSNIEEFGTTKKRIHPHAEDGLLPVSVTNAKRQRAGLLWVPVVVFLAVICVLLSPLRHSTLWATSLSPCTNSLAGASGKEAIEKPTVPAGLTGNGRTNDVLWDKYSLVVKGQRIFLQYVRPYTEQLVHSVYYCWSALASFTPSGCQFLDCGLMFFKRLRPGDSTPSVFTLTWRCSTLRLE